MCVSERRFVRATFEYELIPTGSMSLYQLGSSPSEYKGTPFGDELCGLRPFVCAAAEYERAKIRVHSS